MRRATVGRAIRTSLLGCAVVAAIATPAVAVAGRLDRTFGRDGQVTAFPGGASGYAVALDARGRIVVAGYTTRGKADFAVARFLPNGTPDPEFGRGDGRVTIDLGGRDFAFDLAVGERGRIVVAGRRERAARSVMAVTALGPRGRLDRRFSKDGVAFVRFGKQFQDATAVAIGASDRIVLGGTASNGEASRWAMARLRPNGSRDRSFGGDGRVSVDISRADEQINDLVIVEGGTIVTVGSAAKGLSPRIALGRFLVGGELDRSFADRGIKITNVAPGADIGLGLAPQPDGKVVVAAQVANGGTGAWGVLRYGRKGRWTTTSAATGSASSRSGPTTSSLVRLPFSRTGGSWSRGASATADDQWGIVRLKGNGSFDKGFAKSGRATVGFGRGSDTARAWSCRTTARS